MAESYEVSSVKAGLNVSPSVMWQIKAGGMRVKVKEIGVFVAQSPATAPVFTLFRSATTGTATTSLAGQLCDVAGNASAAALETAWSTAPTVGAVPFRHIPMALTPGAGVILTFPEPIVIPINGGLSIVNLNAAGLTIGQFSCYVKFDE